jgi:hypothetical protein
MFVYNRTKSMTGKNFKLCMGPFLTYRLYKKAALSYLYSNQ